MIRTILVPLDGSSHAERALHCSGCLAKQLGAQIILLHVLEQSPAMQVHGERHLVDGAEAERYLTQAAERSLPPDVPRRIHVHTERTSRVAASIANHDQEFACDLIVISPHGPLGWRGWMEGNIPQRIARKIETPILIVSDKVCHGTCLFQHFLVPDDATPAHEGSWDVCIELARACRASVRLVNALEPAAAATFLPRSAELLLDVAGDQAARHLRDHVTELEGAGLHATSEVVRGNAYNVIRDAMAAGENDLLVLRSHRRAGLEAWFAGSLSARLLHRVKTSVLLIPL